jgi:wobble nucleotide-excising tRNase
MIRKLLTLQNIGRFQSYAAAGDTEFRQLTMIFGENGHGKTTLSAVLRSLQSGDPAHITERRTLSGSGNPEARILLETGTVTFTGGAWSTRLPGIEVFDETFVHRNVYAGDCVGHEQRKNLYRIIVGEEGVRLADQVDRLDDRIRDANKRIAERKQVVAAHVPAGMDLDDFIALPNDPEVAAKIAAADSELVALKHASEIRGKGLLQPLTLPELPDNFRQHLAQDISGLTTAAAERVRNHLQVRLKGTGEGWILQGLGHADGESCPFCGQGVDEGSLIEAYRGLFGQSYQDVKDAAVRVAEEISSAFGDRSILRLQRAHAENERLCVFWRAFVAFDPPAIGFDEIQSAIESMCQTSSALAGRKVSTPLEPVTPGVEFDRAMDRYRVVRAAVEAYNAAVERVNGLLSAKKAATESGGPSSDQLASSNSSGQRTQ